MKLLSGEWNWAPKMEVYVGDNNELEKLRSTVANKSEFEARLYFLSIDKHIVYLIFHLCFSIEEVYIYGEI